MYLENTQETAIVRRQKMKAHIYFLNGSSKRVFHQYCSFILSLVLLTCLTTTSIAQQDVNLSEESTATPEDVNSTVALNFPYIAEINGNDVNIRSGPGTNYYRCGKLNKGDKVEVVSTQLGWSRIVPPSGSFSWISMQYVSVSLDDPTTAIVTGDGARVYAGSDYVEPMHSTTRQVTLTRGDTVKLLGEEKDDYYKIVPPPSAYLWVSSKYTIPVSPVETPQPTAIDANESTALTTTTEPSVEDQMLKEYNTLREKVEAERAKPIEKQNYTDMKNALSKIANNKEAGKAARYAEFTLEQIKRFELAQKVAKQVQLQNEQLQKIKQKIDKAYSERLVEIQNLGKFAVIGKFQNSNLYERDGEIKHYRITEDSGANICYATPTGQAVKMDLSKFIGCKVGLIGKIEPHPPSAGAIVRFTEVIDLTGYQSLEGSQPQG
jgi:uncharacterized protein YgiM (DUF1202 family)